MKLTEKILAVTLLLIIIFSGIIRYLQVRNYNSPFTYDQARDMLDLRVIAGFHSIQVPGPTTSITGLNLGPFYYYFNLPAFWLSGGNPQALVYWNLFWFLAAGAIIFGFFYKRNIWLGWIISIVFLMSPQLFSVTRYFWNANAVVYFIVFYFLGLWNFLENKSIRNALIFGITAGLVIQFEAAFGSLCVVFSILVIILSRSKNNFKFYFIGLLPWFLPQLAFEIKHKFQMTKLFLGTLSGANPILGEKISMNKVFLMHINTILPYFEGQFMVAYGVGVGLLVAAIIIILLNRKYRIIGMYFIGMIVFAIFYYTVIYHHELKSWYLEGIRVWYCFMIGMAIVSVSKCKNIVYVVVGIFILRSFWLTAFDQNVYIAENGHSNNPKNMANLMTNIDWIYKNTNGMGFKAFNYVPEVYDFSAQYLYWWYGKYTYGYMPEKVSYSISYIPDYVRMQNIFYAKNRLSNDKLIALTYETQSTYKDWLEQFKDYCVVNKQVTAWNMVLEIRQKCEN